MVVRHEAEQDMVKRIPKITAVSRVVPPQWALAERLLIDQLNKAALEFVARYARADGTLVWRHDWPGMDGSDDPYEGFMNLALLYALGGSAELYGLARHLWEGITWQWTEYGQIYREFDAYYDWMHHGEGYLFFYFLGLAGPVTLKERQRAARFAGMYMGEDAEAANYDAERRLIRSPINGSRGPQFELKEEDWSTHRGILDHYPAPYEDIPGVDYASGTCAWSDDEVYANVIRLMNERMIRGDVPLNLNATGLVAHAYLMLGEEKYRGWVLDYLAAWEERTQRNGGIIPDNVGLSGAIGQYNDDKWWGGYYGWRWPHGWLTIIEPLTNACMNAVLLTGDMGKLDLARGQLDANWALGEERGDRWHVPHKHLDSGWTDYRPSSPYIAIHLWTVSMADEDLKRIERTGSGERWNEAIVPGLSPGYEHAAKTTKHYIGNTVPWFQYIRGRYPDYPQHILDANCRLLANQLAKMRSVEGDPLTWTDRYHVGDFSSIHAWQEMCPVYMESLVQLTLGGPMHISHGGLQHGRVRYFDADLRRPGLPESVAALVSHLANDSVTLELINVDLFADHTVVIQAGMFGEHSFKHVHVRDVAGKENEIRPVNNKWLLVELPAGTGAILHLSMDRYVHAPSYEMPWSDHRKNSVLLEGRSGHRDAVPGG